MREVVLVMNTHNTDAVCTLVLNQQGQSIIQPKQQLKMSQSQFYVIQLNKQLHQIVMVENTKLPH